MGLNIRGTYCFRCPGYRLQVSRAIAEDFLFVICFQFYFGFFFTQDFVPSFIFLICSTIFRVPPPNHDGDGWTYRFLGLIVFTAQISPPALARHCKMSPYANFAICYRSILSFPLICVWISPIFLNLYLPIALEIGGLKHPWDLLFSLPRISPPSLTRNR